MAAEAGPWGLRWLIDEVTVTLEEATAALAAYLAAPTDRQQLQFCQAYLHQVSGSLQLAQSAGGTLLIEAMEATVEALLRGEIASGEQAGEALAAAAAALPGYLDRCLAERREQPALLIALLNDLRALCRQPLASEGGLFSADLTPFENASLAPPPTRDQSELGALCRKLRQIYQHALLGLLKGEQTDRQHELMRKVAQRMGELFAGSRRGQLWELCGQVLSHLGQLPRIGPALRQLFWELDRDLRACDQPDRDDVEQPPVSRALFKNLLYYAAAAAGEDRQELRDAYAIEPGLCAGDSDDLWPARGRAVRATLQRELRDELQALRRQGEDRAQSGDSPAAAAARLRPSLRRLRDTLTVADLRGAAAAAERAAALLEEDADAPANSGWKRWADEIETLERLIDGWTATGAEPGDERSTRKALVDAATAAVIGTVRGLLDKIKDAVIGYASAPHDDSRLTEAIECDRQIQRALEVIEQQRLSAVIAACGDHLERLAEISESPSWARLDTLADCLIAAEYYLDLLAQGDETGERVLAQAEQRVQRLRDETAAATEAQLPASPPPGTAPSIAPHPGPQEVDAEIRDIFIDEAREVLHFLSGQEIRGTAGAPPAALGEIRRGFHTLKGSGRMVGATELAALCWAVEQLLNRVLEGDLGWSDAASELVAEARARLPELIEAFAAGTGTGPTPQDVLLIERAERLATGGSTPETTPPVTTAQEQEPLAEDFREEAMAQLEILEHFLAAQHGAAPGPRPESVARAIHTLVGCCERLHHQPLSRALRTLEALATRYAERGDIPGPEGLEAVAGVLGGCRDLVAGGDTKVDLDAHNLRLEQARDSLLRSGPRAREPLQALMAEDLEALLTAAQWLPTTTAEAWGERLPALLGELDKLAAAAAEGELVTLADAAGLLAESARALVADPGAAAGRADFGRGIEQLLAMLDAVAASLPPPSLDTELEACLRLCRQPQHVTETKAQKAGEEPRATAEPPAPAPHPETSGAFSGRTLDEAPDAELVAIFLEEAAELTEQIEQSITHWRDGDAPEDRAENLKRALHTLKGSARMAGCSTLGSLCHDFETLVLATTPGAADTQFFDTCLAFYDRIEQQREQIARGDRRAPPQTAPAPTPLRAEPTPRAVPPPAAESRSAPAPPSAPAAGILFRSSGITPPWRRTVREGGTERGLIGTGQPREVVKIAASILDKLVNLADETSISRSRIEQQLQQFHFQLEEMETTVDRFHDQVRRLGMETEAQIQFRREQLISEGSEDQFDPLEMDRYSTLQQLSRALEESASDLHDLQDTLLTKARETEALLIQQARINRELQENLSLTRMVPFSRIVPRLRRIVRQTASELGKPVELELHNIEGEMDRSVLERIVPSLEHLIRNAIDHGIEVPERRGAAGKPETGRVSITFSREAGDVVIQLADDGCGLDLGAIRSKAESLGLLNPDAVIGEQDLTQLIFHPGFSTSSAVSQISGRGIGMDVVDSELRQLGGSVTPRSRDGEGTEFTLRLPFTVSVNRALLMKTGRERYGTLVNNVSGVVRLDVAELEQLRAQAETGFAYRGERFAVCRLGDLIGSTEPGAELAPGKSALVLTKGTSEPTAVLVDALEPSQEVVVKSLGPQFAKVRGLSGATVLGDGQVVPILDLNALITDRVAPRSALRHSTTLSLPEPQTEASGPTVLVVDDSVTMRKATGRLLERQGYKVLSARDGVEAMQLLQELTPDLMLLDVEMPRMDGFEVTRQVRASERLRALPIVMITSRSGDKHRNKALELGVDHYLGKPYQEEHLLAVVETCLPPTGASQRESGHGL